MLRSHNFFNSINLPLESAKRDVKVHVLPVPGRKCEIKPEPSTSSAAAAKKPSSFFGVNQATKKEKTSPDVKPASTNGAFAEEAATPIAVKVEKKSPVKKESPKKAKIASGRSAISSFFSSKPAAKPSASGRERAEEVKTKNDVFVKKETQMETVESTQVASNKKRTLSETNSKFIVIYYLLVQKYSPLRCFHKSLIDLKYLILVYGIFRHR